MYKTGYQNNTIGKIKPGTTRGIHLHRIIDKPKGIIVTLELYNYAKSGT